MNFASDNVYGVHPKIMEALAAANHGTAASYGADRWTARAQDALNEVFEREVHAFLVTSGTVANGLALSALTPVHGAVACHRDAHITVEECGAVELFSGGAQLTGIDGVNGKIDPGGIEAAFVRSIRNRQADRPTTISLTQSSEFGTVYTLDEVTAICELARRHGAHVHMDGARFANAVASLNCSPAELTWKAGIDVMSFGATKNGAMMLEAVIFFGTEPTAGFTTRLLRAGQRPSKNRYLAAQMIAYLSDGLWLQNAHRANAAAAALAQGLATSPDVRLPSPTQANEVFAVMTTTLADRLRTEGARFQTWPGDTVGRRYRPGEHETLIRLVTSFQTASTDIDRFLALVAQEVLE